MTERGGFLFHNLLLFGRLLRGLGMDVDSGRMIDLFQTLDFIEIDDRTDFYYALRGLFVHRCEEIEVFDQAFELFWRDPSHALLGMTTRLQGHIRRRKPVIVPPPLRLEEKNTNPAAQGASPDPHEPPVIQATLTYSDREVLRRKDFSELNPEELERIKRMLAEMVWQLGQRRTRRFHPGYGRLLDMRHTLRENLRFGGEMLAWAEKQPRYKSRPLVILADVSGSMERYTRLLLHFCYSLDQGFAQGVETFVFSTHLTRITHPLRERSIEQALRQVSDTVTDWSGGTRIGEALKAFNFRWARRVLGHGAVVLLISDGWDRGDPQVLRTEIARLQRSCYRLIWLNPLLGGKDYEPLARGMRTALPYIDDFMPVHNLASLDDLAVHLKKIDEYRPVRRQNTYLEPEVLA